MLKESILRVKKSLFKLKPIDKSKNLETWNVPLTTPATNTRETSERSRDKLIILVLHASDFEFKLEDSSRHSSLCPTNVESLFQLIFVNIDSIEHNPLLGDLISTNNPEKSKPSLVCILLSEQMSRVLHTRPSWNTWLERVNVFLLYDELNEIEMFKLKYRLPRCVQCFQAQLSLASSIRESILHHAFCVVNENLVRLIEPEETVDGRHCSIHDNKAVPDTPFELSPRKLKQRKNEKVYISLAQCLASDDQLDILLNGKSSMGVVRIKQLNPMTLYFSLPAKYCHGNANLLKISLVLNCTTFLGSRTIAIVPASSCAISKSNLLVSLTSLDFLCQTFGVETTEQVDLELARVFDSSLTDFGIYSHLCTSSQINFWLPTWLHFAAFYNLREFALHLLRSPAAVRACHVCNSEGLTPSQVALAYGNHELAEIITNFTHNIKHIEHDLIRLSNVQTRFGFLAPKQPPPACMQRHKSFSGAGDFINQLPPRERRNTKIEAAKNELLELIDKFKAGLSIKTFECLFANWENSHRDILTDHVSNEFQHSLNEIRKLCSSEIDDHHQQETKRIDSSYLISRF